MLCSYYGTVAYMNRLVKKKDPPSHLLLSSYYYLVLQYIFKNRLVLYKKRVNEFHTNSFHTDVHGIIPSKPPIIPTFSCKIVLSLDSMFHHRT